MLILFQCMLLLLDQINVCDSDVTYFFLLSMPLNSISALILEKIQRCSSFATAEQYKYSWYKGS